MEEYVVNSSHFKEIEALIPTVWIGLERHSAGIFWYRSLFLVNMKTFQGSSEILKFGISYRMWPHHSLTSGARPVKLKICLGERVSYPIATVTENKQVGNTLSNQ